MIQWLTYSSKAIKDFPMADPHVRSFPVYLPPDYDPKRSEPYPVIYMLAGFASRGAKYIADDMVYTIPFPIRLDQAIQSNELPPVIVVFPDATSKLGCSQFINSPAFGNYMDYIADELVNFIDEQFHTHRDANFRGVAGHSSGGFGALMMAMMRPEMFKFICSSASDSFYEISLLPHINDAIIAIETAGGVNQFIEWFLKHPNPTGTGSKNFMAMILLAMAPCFAPNVNKSAIFGDLFFDIKSGAILENIWEKYLAWDPIRMIDKYADALRTLKWLHLVAGSQDEHALQLGHRQIANNLDKLNIKHQINEFVGGHTGQSWRFIEWLTLMVNKMYQI